MLSRRIHLKNRDTEMNFYSSGVGCFSLDQWWLIAGVIARYTSNRLTSITWQQYKEITLFIRGWLLTAFQFSTVSKYA